MHRGNKVRKLKHSDFTSNDRLWCAVPVYNNKETVRSVVEGCLSMLKNVLVVDDGSTDADVSELLSGLDVVVLKHKKNMGKGKAILTASGYIEDHDGIYMVTIDADGQHNPEDIRKFIPLMLEDDKSMIIGCRNFDTENVPDSSRFGRKFANFWLRVETGVHVDDCQSGFRAYPVKYLNQFRIRGLRYDFEADVLARFAWAGLELKTVDIDVRYPPREERISHFKPFLDNLRISHVHVMLIARRLLPIPHKRLVAREKPNLKLMFHPMKVLKKLLREHATPGGLAAAAAVGIFFAVLPLIFVHTLVILYITSRLNLNKFVAVNVQHICMPPFVPALCIEVGYFMRNGQWLSDISFATIFNQFSDRLLEWFLGSLVIAPIGAVLAATAVYFTASALRARQTISSQF